MKIEIISIGDELLIGQTVNTNASFIGESFTLQGYDVKWMVTVKDILEDIVCALKTAENRSDVVLLTGGLGPTQDDLTRNAISEYLDSPLVLNEDIVNRIRKIFIARNIEMPETNKSQAYFPESAKVLKNPVGTAQGIYFEKNETQFFSMPGVPMEVKAMVPLILKQITIKGEKHHYLKTLLHTSNTAESILSQRLIDFNTSFPTVQLAYLPKLSGVTLRLSILSNSKEKDTQILKQAEHYIYEHAGVAVYGKENETLESAVGSLLISQQKTLSVAESCTGGLISHKLTNVPGSSAYLMRGVVAYSNETKMQLLNVPEQVIRQHGAVSEKTAKAMAKGIRLTSHTDIGLSITGIAGPEGGSKEKPVGTVYIGYSDKNKTSVSLFHFFKDRLLNKERFAVAALDLLRKELLQVTSLKK